MQLADSKVFQNSRTLDKKKIIVNFKLFKYVRMNIVVGNVSYTVIGIDVRKEI